MHPKKLNGVKYIVTHEGCPDGIASAILLLDAFYTHRRTPELHFVQHGQPSLLNLPALPGMLFCDITPPRDRVQEFINVGALVLDHHEKQEDIVRMFGDNGVYADKKTEPGVSGAVLAFREVWWPYYGECFGSEVTTKTAQDFATLAGIRDTWQKKHHRWREACEQAAALKFYPWHHFAGISRPFSTGWKTLKAKLDIGPILFDKTLEFAKNRAETAYRYKTSKGTRLVIVATGETSDIAEAIEDCDILVGFFFSSRLVNEEWKFKITLSMRSRGTYDVGNFALALGGGGHAEAAGATIDVDKLNITNNPYNAIIDLLGDYENGWPAL